MHNDELDRAELSRLLSPLLGHVTFPISLSRVRQGDAEARSALRTAVKILAFTVQARWAESHNRRFSLNAIHNGVEHALDNYSGWNPEEFAIFVATSVLREAEAEYAAQ